MLMQINTDTDADTDVDTNANTGTVFKYYLCEATNIVVNLIEFNDVYYFLSDIILCDIACAFCIIYFIVNVNVNVKVHFSIKSSDGNSYEGNNDFTISLAVY